MNLHDSCHTGHGNVRINLGLLCYSLQGCCGYKDFSDYVTEPSCSSSTALQDQKLIKFKAPASCCKRPTTINGVHRNYCQNLTELDENQYLSCKALISISVEIWCRVDAVLQFSDQRIFFFSKMMCIST